MNVLSTLKIILGMETKGFPTARQQIKGFVEGTQRDIAQLKTFIGGYFTAQFAGQLVHSVSQMVGRFKDLNETSGESLETIQKYDQVFKKFGGTAEDAIKIFDELALARKEALEKGGEAGIKLQRLGLTPQEIQSLETGRQLYERIAQIANGNGGAKQREAFLAQFGKKRGGMALAGANALNEGGEFSIVSDENVQKLDEAAKAFEKAALEFKIASVPLVAALTEFGSEVLNWLQDSSGERAGKKALLDRSTDLTGEAAGIIRGINEKTPIRSRRTQEERDKQAEAQAIIDSLQGGELTEARLRAAQIRLASLKSGRKMTEPEGTAWYDKAIMEANGGAGPFSGDPDFALPDRGLQMMPEDIRNRRRTMGDAFDSVFFRAGNSEDKKQMLREKIKRDLADAQELDDKGDYGGADKLRSGSIKSAGELADLLATPHKEFQSDQLAQVGGLIGGAATIDPSLTIQQSQLQVLQSILSEFPALREALSQRNQPHQDLQ